MPCIPRESCCASQAELSSLPAGKINDEWFLIKGREREFWLLPIRGDFRGQSLQKKKIIICCRKGEVCTLTGYKKWGAGQAISQQHTGSLVPLLRVLANLPPPFVTAEFAFPFNSTAFPLCLAGALWSGSYIHPHICHFIQFWSHFSTCFVFPGK